MSKPTSPQEALRLQHSMITAVWVLLVLLAGVIVVGVLVTALIGSAAGAVGLLAMAGVFVPLFIALLMTYRSDAENLRRHIVGADQHACQCSDCGRPFAPAPDCPPAPPSGRIPPQPILARAQAMLRAAPISGLILLAALVALFVLNLTRDSGDKDAFALIFLALIIFILTLGLIAILISAKVHSDSSQRAIAGYPPNHGCTCRWCSRTNMTMSRRPGIHGHNDGGPTRGQ